MAVKDASDLKWLNSKDLCKILSECRKAGVKSLEIGPLFVEFGQVWVEHDQITPREAYEPINADSPTVEIEEKDEVAAKEYRLQQMLIEDPAAYEKLINEGEIEVAEA